MALAWSVVYGLRGFGGPGHGECCADASCSRELRRSATGQAVYCLDRLRGRQLRGWSSHLGWVGRRAGRRSRICLPERLHSGLRCRAFSQLPGRRDREWISALPEWRARVPHDHVGLHWALPVSRFRPWNHRSSRDGPLRDAVSVYRRRAVGHESTSLTGRVCKSSSVEAG
jgi:hypothetical protein